MVSWACSVERGVFILGGGAAPGFPAGTLEERRRGTTGGGVAIELAEGRRATIGTELRLGRFIATRAVRTTNPSRAMSKDSPPFLGNMFA